MNLKKTIILAIATPLLFLVLAFLYNIYSNHQNHKIISNFCFDTNISDSTDKVFKLATKQGLKYSQKDSLIEINKKPCTCKLKTKDNIVIEKAAVVCVY